MNDINSKIKPFSFLEYTSAAGNGYSVILNAGMYKDHIFEMRSDDGFEGGGYDWANLASTFLELNLSHLAEKISFDPEADMFSAYSSDKDALVSFITQFHAFCEDEPKMIALFQTLDFID
ncbi:Imm51 family immunity protein [Thorsellia anophelis]|uniref:Immunity protein 51 n=1 Tax=Thorsellia anophelis DSM 18579 TaxID=1123402 RepID=A0A1H9Y9Q7_9GAMM|nr:Imm51 family immunity protein [Thorsellia anophelis]SES65668.1 Immunity protein 51 [Thorsellia anophelis DSM 18579]